MSCEICDCDCHDYRNNGKWHCMYCHPESKPDDGVYVEGLE
jgi:hypothetical protein